MGETWQRAAARRAAVVVATAIAGAVVMLVADGFVQTLGWAVLGLAGVLAVALVFLEVGYSEDRAREREERHSR